MTTTDTAATEVRLSETDRPALFRLLFERRYGNPIWDGVLRLSGVAALLAIPLTLLVPPAGGMVGFAIVTIWVNGPASPVLPSTYEPILMLMGRLYPPLLVAVVGVAGTIYVEYLNYHLYRRVLQVNALGRVKRGKTVDTVLKYFSKAPFLTVWVCSWSPLPYWPVRFISPLAGYDVRRHLTATFLGRFPRLWFVAWLGVWWNVSIGVLVAISFGSIGVALAIYLLRRRLDRGGDTSIAPAAESPEAPSLTPRS